MCDEFKNLLILEFPTAKEAADFAKDINPESELYLSIYDVAPNSEWLFVVGICDICNEKQCFFIPAAAYEDDFIGSECGNCGNMSVYPKEGDWKDENS